MTSFAGSKSWNFCGRRGVNSATAWRTVAGSNEVIGGNDLDVNREIGRRPGGHGDATTRISRCRSTVADKLRLRPVRGRGLFAAADCLRLIHDRCRCLFADDGGRCLCADTDCSRTRLVAWTERDHGLFADMANTRLRPVLTRFAYGICRVRGHESVTCAAVPRLSRDSFADAESLLLAGVRLVLS